MSMAIRGTPAEWTAVETSLVSTVLELRKWARGRDADIHVVVIQSDRDTPSVGGGRGGSGATSAAIAEERAASEILSERLTALRRRAGLDGSAVTALYRSDVSGALGASPLIAGLDAALRDRALGYYRARSRHTKAVLTRLTSPGQGALRARLLFKIAHFNEFRGKIAKALKYYSLSYAALVSMAGGAAGTTCSPAFRAETRGVAECANFKIMRIYLAAGTNGVTTPSGMSGLTGAQAAIMQFAAHLRAWEDAALATSGPALPYVPGACGWVSRQYVIAAELLQLNLSRPTLETRANHVPEHYYHTAALWAVRRRVAAETQGAITHGSSAPGAALQAAETELAHWHVVSSPYIGGAPHFAPVAGGPPLRSRDEAARAHLIQAESRVPHFDVIFSLLEKAQATAIIDGGSGGASRALQALVAAGTETTFSPGSSFSYFLSPTASRARLWRQWLIADEFYARGEAMKALRLLLPIAALMRSDPWGSKLLPSIAKRVKTAAGAINAHGLEVVAAFDELSAAVSSGNDGLSRKLLHDMRKASAGLGAATAANIHPTHAPYLAIDNRAWNSRTFVTPSQYSQALVASRGTGRNVVAASVCFSQRSAPGGAIMAVRIFLSSLLPEPLPLSRVEVNCSGVDGDLGLAGEGGGALPSASAAVPEASVSAVLLSWDGSSPHPKGAVVASASDTPGVFKVTLESDHVDASQPRVILVRDLTLGCAGAPALCVEYTVRAPSAASLGLASSADVPAALAVLAAEARTVAFAEDVLVEAAGNSASIEPVANAASGSVKRKMDVNLTCTDPSAMAGVAQGSPVDASAAAKVLHMAQQGAHERTIFCTLVRCVVTEGFILNLLPIRLVPLASGLLQQQRPTSRRSAALLSGDLVGGADAMAIESYLGTKTADEKTRVDLVIKAIADATPACVAHLTRFAGGKASDGLICGHPGVGAHSALLVTEAQPDASLSISQDCGSLPIVTTAGMEHSLSVTIVNGRSSLVGGAVFIHLAACNSSHFASAARAGGLTDVSLDGAAKSSEKASDAAVDDADTAKQILLNSAAAPVILVPKGLQLIHADGSIKSISEGAAANELVDIKTCGALGISIPALQAGETYNFKVAVAFSDSKQVARAVLTARMRIVQGDAALGRSGEKGSAASWVRTLLDKPYLHRSALSRQTIFVRSPLELANFLLTPDASAPLCNLAPLLLRSPPFSRLRMEEETPQPPVSSGLQIFSLLPLSPNVGAAPRAGHVRIRSTFRVSVTVRSAAATTLMLTGARLLEAPGADGGAFEWMTDTKDIFSQLPGTHCALESTASPLLLAAFSCPAATRVHLDPGYTVTFTLMARAAREGEFELGSLELLWSSASGGTAQSTRLSLPAVVIHDPPITCDLTLPFAGSSSCESLTLGVRLTNKTVHFVALEAAAYAPGSLATAGSSRGDATSSLPPLAAAPPMAFSIELLPGASKSVSLALPLRSLEGYTGPVALPGFTLRAIEASGAGVTGAGTLPPEAPIPAEKRALLAIASATMFLEARAE